MLAAGQQHSATRELVKPRTSGFLATTHVVTDQSGFARSAISGVPGDVVQTTMRLEPTNDADAKRGSGASVQFRLPRAGEVTHSIDGIGFRQLEREDLIETSGPTELP